jgi:hypothetical protein
MTREGCVRADAVRAVAVLALLTAFTWAGCAGTKRGPEVAQPPPSPTLPARVATLRVGLPSPQRGNLLFRCDTPPNEHLPPLLGTAGYELDSLDLTGRRWLRLHLPPMDSAAVLAPDTLIVRAFGDATDEEIALERGELDVAVFWPGELSARMRSDERFRDPELGLRERGVLAFVTTPDDTLGAPRADMDLLNREAFGGDLLSWSELAPGSGDGPPARYTVDSAMPGARHLERILARIPGAGATRTLKLTYVDEPERQFRMPAPGAPSPAGGPIRRSTHRPLFAIRCPVVARPEARADVRAIGAPAFAGLAPCARGNRP